VAGEIDITRAVLKDKDLFPPFDVGEMFPLRKALTHGDVHEETPVLLIEGEAGSLALLTQQMTYHHVAQGEMAGWPWMVSF